MKQRHLKTAFVIVVFVLTVILLIPAMFLVDTLFPLRPGPDSIYRDQGNTMPSMIVLSVCFWFANLITSHAFRAMRLSENRWSLFRRGLS